MITSPSRASNEIKPSFSNESLSLSSLSLASTIAPTPLIDRLIEVSSSGSVNHVLELIEQQKSIVNEKNQKNETALHWAAVNNQLEVVKILIDHGAEVDVEGGKDDLLATPLHWACQCGLVYTVDYLISKGADPLKTNGKGYNCLQIAVNASSALLVIYLLHQQIPVDSVDQYGRTPLHWAAYHSDHVTIHSLLEWGADINKRDLYGYTPLHWALVVGNPKCLALLLAEGADPCAITNDAKTTWDIAEKNNCLRLWKIILAQGGKYKNGRSRPIFMSKETTDKVVLIISQFLITIVLIIFTHLSIIKAILSTLFIIVSTLLTLKCFILPNAYRGKSAVLHSPLLAGMVFGTLIWIFTTWLLILLPNSFEFHPCLNFIAPIAFTFIILCLLRCSFMDPGYIPKSKGKKEQKQLIDDLISKHEYNYTLFCLKTFVKKPLRSGYSPATKKLVAKLDHYCPWINNEVGIRNHRVFIIFLISCTLFCPLYFILAFIHFNQFEYDSMDIQDIPYCEIFGETVCRGYINSPIILTLSTWLFGLYIWIFILLCMQLIQISKGVTTLESLTIYEAIFEFKGHKGSSCSHSHCKQYGIKRLQHRISKIIKTIPKKIYERFKLLKLYNDSFYSSFSYDCITNLIDFWKPFDSILSIIDYRQERMGLGSLGGIPVDYYQLYSIPKLSKRWNEGSKFIV